MSIISKLWPFRKEQYTYEPPKIIRITALERKFRNHPIVYNRIYEYEGGTCSAWLVIPISKKEFYRFMERQPPLDPVFPEIDPNKPTIEVRVVHIDGEEENFFVNSLTEVGCRIESAYRRKKIA